MGYFIVTQRHMTYSSVVVALEMELELLILGLG
jgi:hypothetical protein